MPVTNQSFSVELTFYNRLKMKIVSVKSGCHADKLKMLPLING